MKEIQLEVGKTYEVRNPKRVEKLGFHITDRIVKYRPDAKFFKWLGESGDVYSEDGQFYRSGKSHFDLVREVTTNQKSS